MALPLVIKYAEAIDENHVRPEINTHLYHVEETGCPVPKTIVDVQGNDCSNK